MHRQEPQGMPDWLIGLIIAVVLAVVVFALANILGAGDDPVIATTGR